MAFIPKVLDYFLKEPHRKVHLRQLARELGISPYATKVQADLLIREGLLMEEREANLRYLRTRNGVYFRRLKAAFSVGILERAGTVDIIRGQVAGLVAVVLYGSMAKGEDDGKSDIDVLVIGQGEVNTRELERKLKRAVSVTCFSWSAWKQQAVRNRAFYLEVILHGVPLYGEVPVV